MISLAIWLVTITTRASTSNKNHRFLNLTRLKEMSMDKRPTFNEDKVHSRYEKVTCSGLSENMVTNNLLLREAQLIIDSFLKPTFYNLLNGGYDNKTDTFVCLKQRKEDALPICTISGSEKCDGFSTCLDDECDCDEEYFKCANGRGCLAVSQVCDSRVDCTDGSDECPCTDYQNCITEFSGSEICGKRRTGCSFNTSAQFEVFEKIKNITRSGDVYKNKTELNTVIKENPEFKFQFSRIDSKERKPVNLFAPILIHYDDQAPIYNCTNSTFIEIHNLRRQINTGYEVICNGEKNCENGIDEQKCPQYFYCESDNKPIPKVKVCDRVPHCTDSSDECQDECAGHGLSSRENLVENRGIEFVIIFQIILILGCNGYSCHFQYKRKVEEPKMRIDQIQCCNLIFYDFLMAIYLLIIIYKHFESKGNFCVHETEWRASRACQVSGFLFFFSTNGALHVVLLTSIARVFGLKDSFSNGSGMAKKFAVLLAVLNLSNMILSLLPIISTVVESPMTDMFLYEHFFFNNPLIATGNKTDLEMMLLAYRNQTIDKENIGKNSTAQILSELNKMFHKGTVFDSSNILSIGYYGKSSMCIPDLYSYRTEVAGFKVAIITMVMLNIVAIGSCYVIILQKFKRSTVQAGQNGGSDKLFFLSVKVYILIAAQALSWVPNVIAMIYSLSGGDVPDVFDEIVIAVISPAYSVLNPCLHTDIVKGVVSAIREWIRRCWGAVRGRDTSDDPEDDAGEIGEGEMPTTCKRTRSTCLILENNIVDVVGGHNKQEGADGKISLSDCRTPKRETNDMVQKMDKSLPTGQKPIGEMPVDEKPVSVGGKSDGCKPNGEKLTSEKQVGENPAGYNPTGEIKPVNDKPTG